VLLFEYQGKRFLEEAGVPVPESIHLRAAEAHDVLAIPFPAVVKAQVLTGGRGKAGGIIRVEDARSASDASRKLIGNRIKDLPVDSVLIESLIPAVREMYVAVLLDGEDQLLLIGREGGVDVETFFADGQGDFATVRIDPRFGLGEYQIRTALDDLGIPAKGWPSFVDIALKMARLFRSLDAKLLEINPLAQLENGTYVALDARIEVDEGAFFRHPELKEIQRARDRSEGILGEMEALEVQYVPMGGNVGLLGSGAGCGVTIMDWAAKEGAKISAFVDIDYSLMGGKTNEAMRLVLDTLIADREVRSIIVNFTTCGIRLDAIAQSLVAVLDGLKGKLKKPVFIHLQGNRASLGQAIVRDAGYDVYESLGEAVRGACRAAKEAALA
jgi:succinyl-CoA synthetase beta subunit